MLVLRRQKGQLIEITHKSGDVIRVWVSNIRTYLDTPIDVDLGFEDDLRNFDVQRPERFINQEKKNANLCTG